MVRYPGEVDGLDDFTRAIVAMQRRIDNAGRGIVTEGLAVVERAAKGNFEGAHPPGFPHVGGSKPNIVTGNLRRGITSTPARHVGVATWEGDVGPTAVYGRRIELGYPGGGSGPGHQMTRPFPYMKPAADASHARLQGVAVKRWGKAVAL
jgi:hypothetical protein